MCVIIFQQITAVDSLNVSTAAVVFYIVNTTDDASTPVPVSVVEEAYSAVQFSEVDNYTVSICIYSCTHYFAEMSIYRNINFMVIYDH